MSNSLKILIPVLSFGRAGGMRVLSKLANHWKCLGCDVSFVSFYQSENPYFPVNVEITWIDSSGNKINVNNSIYNAKNSAFKRMYALLKYLKKNSEKYDIVLANHNLSVWPVWIGSKVANFYYIQAYEVEFTSQKGVGGVLKRCGTYLTYFLPLTRVVNADIYKNYKNLRAYYVVPPGLDLEIYYPKELIESESSKACPHKEPRYAKQGRKQ